MDDNFRIPSKEDLAGEKKENNYGFRNPLLEELEEAKTKNYGFHAPTKEDLAGEKKENNYGFRTPSLEELENGKASGFYVPDDVKPKSR